MVYLFLVAVSWKQVFLINLVARSQQNAQICITKYVENPT